MYPQWHTVECNKKFSLIDIVCTNKTSHNLLGHRTNTFSTTLGLSSTTKCGHKFISFRENCYKLSASETKSESSHGGLKSFQTILKYLSQVSQLKPYFRLQNITVKYNQVTGNMQICNHFGGKHPILYFVLSLLQKQLQMTRESFQLQTVQCDNSEFVPAALLAAGQTRCNHSHSLLLSTAECAKTCLNLKENNASVKPVCPDLYYFSQEACCLPFYGKCGSSGQQCELAISHKQFTVYIKASSVLLTNVSLSNLNNKEKQSTNLPPMNDCTRYDIEQIENHESSFDPLCAENDKMPCTFGCNKCFFIHKLCVYELDQDAQKVMHLMHCPSGAHLKNCEEMECHNMLKCPKSYCVPYR